MVITWLSNSIVPEIRSSLVYIASAIEMWKELHVRFTQNNRPRIFELRTAMSSLVQDRLTISAYYTKFKKLYDDFTNAIKALVCTCTAKLEQAQHDEMMKVTQFLMGLNDNFTNIRGQLLMMSHLPSMNQVLALLQQEERQRNMSHSGGSSIEAAVLLSQHTSNPSSGNRFHKPPFKKNDGKSNTKKGNLYCTHCQGTNHTKKRCFHIIGFPPKKQGSKDKRTTRFASSSEDKVVAQVRTLADSGQQSDNSQHQANGFTPVQYQQLMNLLSQAQTPSAAISQKPPQSGSPAFSCSYMTSVCLLNFHSTTEWILDSGATDHITYNNDHLENLTPCFINICLPNGQSTVVHFKGSLKLTPSITLYDVLLIPDFKFNLISVSKLCQNLSCVIYFHSHNCIIQDPMKKRVLGIGTLHGNLYKLLLRSATSQHSILSVSCSSTSIPANQLWHDRMGHSPLHVIKTIDSISPHISVPKQFHCSVCHFAKQNRLVFPVSDSRASKAFELIHCDLWGPYKHTTYSTCHSFLTIVDDYSRCT